jgi:hypothetical protein
MRTRSSIALASLLLISIALALPSQAPAGKRGTPKAKVGSKPSSEKAWTVFEPPASIAVDQKVKNAPEGWTVAYDDRPAILAGVTFYDGPPEEMASLVYDRQKTVGRKWIATWVFDPDAPKGTWVEFHFAGTSAMLRKELPKGVSAGEVTCDRDEHVDGYEKILTIRIR